MKDFPRFKSLVEMLAYRAEYSTNEVKIEFLNDKGQLENGLSYQQLDQSSRQIAARLADAGCSFKNIIILCPPGIEYIKAFFACMYAGAVPVPAYPPMGGKDIQRVKSIVRDCESPLILTTHLLHDLVEDWVNGKDQDSNSQKIKVLSVEDLDSASMSSVYQSLPSIRGEDTAFLQYTSGSTGQPKGVVVSHENLLSNFDQIIKCFAGSIRNIEENSHLFGTVIWLPPYHDMGLIGGILTPIFANADVTLMSPITFLKDPYIWLKTLSDKKALISGGPNFSYNYCVKRVSEEQKANLDLSNWRIAFNGAEPINMEAMSNFSSYFSQCGFEKSSFLPCYGLAEGTLFVAGTPPERGPKTMDVSKEALKFGHLKVGVGGEPTTGLVSSGVNAYETEIAIVDPISLVRKPVGEVGEIWVHGPAVCSGYFGKPGYSRSVFEMPIEGEDKQKLYLRTGDLGACVEGELFVTGRMKELIIVNGKNHYPQDIEFSLQSEMPIFRKGCGAAFSVNDKGKEELVLIQEIEVTDLSETEMQSFCQQAKTIVAATHGIQLNEVLLIAPGMLNKTSSGKIQRAEAKRLYLKQAITSIYQWYEVSQCSPKLIASEPILFPIDAETERKAHLSDQFKSWILEQQGVDSRELDLNVGFNELGVDSVAAIDLIAKLETVVERNIPVTELLRFATVQSLIDHIAAERD